MRRALLALIVALAAGDVRAQVTAYDAYGRPVVRAASGLAPPQPPTPPGYRSYEPPAFKPYRPPSVYDDGPFSPAAEARRARRSLQPPAGGAFSPEDEARRRRERDKSFHPF
jgi:hypothetical protein